MVKSQLTTSEAPHPHQEMEVLGGEMIWWERDVLAEEACVLGSMTPGRGRGGVLVPHLMYVEKSFSGTSQRAQNVSLEVGSLCGPTCDSLLGHLRGERWDGQLRREEPKEGELYWEACLLGVGQGEGCRTISMDQKWIHVQGSW